MGVRLPVNSSFSEEVPRLLVGTVVSLQVLVVILPAKYLLIIPLKNVTKS